MPQSKDLAIVWRQSGQSSGQFAGLFAFDRLAAGCRQRGGQRLGRDLGQHLQRLLAADVPLLGLMMLALVCQVSYENLPQPDGQFSVALSLKLPKVTLRLEQCF